MSEKPQMRRKSCWEKIREYFKLQKDQQPVSQIQENEKVSNDIPPVRKKKKLLLLDLDETLVYSSVKEIHSSEFQIQPLIDNQVRKYFVSVRDGARSFIEKMSSFFEIGVFTASPQAYAEAIIKNLDPGGIIKLRYYKDSCILVNNQRVKDLSRIGVDLKDVILIDDQATSFSYQPQNGLLIKAYSGLRQDKVLEKLIPILEKMHSLEDLRPVQLNYQIIRETLRVTSRQGSQCQSPILLKSGNFTENEPSPLQIRKSQNSLTKPNHTKLALTPNRTHNKTLSQFRLNVPSPDRRRSPNKRSSVI